MHLLVFLLELIFFFSFIIMGLEPFFFSVIQKSRVREYFSIISINCSQVLLHFLTQKCFCSHIINYWLVTGASKGYMEIPGSRIIQSLAQPGPLVASGLPRGALPAECCLSVWDCTLCAHSRADCKDLKLDTWNTHRLHSLA